jgi:hypothetical protein
MIELLRNLSNISTQFREEFGRVLWGCTRICLYTGDAGVIPHFIQEYSAVRQGIKSLYLDFDFGCDCTPSYL